MSIMMGNEDAQTCVLLLEAAGLNDIATRVRESLAVGEHDDAFRNAASDKHHREGEIEIDEDAIVSTGEDGAYVNAWIWVPNEDAGAKPAEDDGCPKGDPDCLGNNGDCHDACESPA